MVALGLALLLAVQPPAAPAASAYGPPPSYRLSCAVIDGSGTLSRFDLAVAGEGAARRFRIEPVERAAWAERVDTGAARIGETSGLEILHFLSGGTNYQLSLGLWREAPGLTAEATVRRGRAASVEAGYEGYAQGACAGRRESGDLGLAPLRPYALPPNHRTRPRGITVTATPRLTCGLVTPDAGVITVDLDLVLGADNVATVTPRPGQGWPPQAFQVPATQLAEMHAPEAGGGREEMLLLVIGHQTVEGRRVDMLFSLDHHEFLRFKDADEIIGSGTCRAREEARP
ncbi:MAG TPA: hypothetical protein VK614_08020 [Allosphingosinicella sp.]|nr:hypothetical protein [Allosphingosinicella sp.]